MGRPRRSETATDRVLSGRTSLSARMSGIKRVAGSSTSSGAMP